MQTNLHITYADGSKKTVSTTPADIVAFESKFDLSIARINDNFRMTHLYFLAWHAEHRSKQTTLEFDAWVDSIEAVEGDPKA